MIRQIQRDYPPYPSNIGVYYPKSQPLLVAPATSSCHYSSHSINLQPSQCRSQSPSISSVDQTRPCNINLNTYSNTSSSVNLCGSKFKGIKHPSILKIYKSCPVSPVHEEVDWTNVNDTNAVIDQQQSQKEPIPSKRHSMYSDDAKTILDMIHTNTEKMIAEITQKYGDMDIDKTLSASRSPIPTIKESCNTDKNTPIERNLANKTKFIPDEDGNFSSDSLEDCSLDLDCNTNFQTRKMICKKKHRKNEAPQKMPRRSVSDYFIYDESYLNLNHNVSLSDILNDNKDKEKENYALLSSQRHSSASFFLAPDRKSQESLISDEMSGCGVSYCNSMESILSDESECKSAPLEALFSRTKREIMRNSGNCCDSSKIDPNNSSKSYGSSPNNCIGDTFDYYMDQKQPSNSSFYEKDVCDIASYDYDSLMAANSGSYATSSPPAPPPEFQNKSQFYYTKSMTTSCTYPSLSSTSNITFKNDDFIPRLGSKNDQYSSQMNKSLSKEFANQRKINNSNPMYGCDDDSEFFQRKFLKPTVAPKPSNALTANDFTKLPLTTSEQNNVGIKKSCSFEIEMFYGRGRIFQQNSAAKKYERNLEKFEKDRCQNLNSNADIGGTMEMSYVPHKPPVANRRSGSMKTRRSIRDKDRYHTVSQFPSTYDHTEIKKEKIKEFEAEEKTIEIYVAEKGMVEDDNMDSLELYTKPNLYKENSIDSLDDIETKNKTKSREMLDVGTDDINNSIVTADFLSRTEYMKFRDIEKKIDVINKLVELEEKKLENERFSKEIRMRPFVCNSNKKGYVKSLTLNFDNLAKTMQYEKNLSQRMLSECGKIRRNYSLPDVLEIAKFRLFYDSNLSEEFRVRKEKRLETVAVDDEDFEGVRQNFQYCMIDFITFYSFPLFIFPH